MEIESYHLIAYDIATSQQAFSSDCPAIRRPSAGQIWRNGGTEWEVVGVRSDSTEQEVRIDVKKVGSILTKQKP